MGEQAPGRDGARDADSATATHPVAPVQANGRADRRDDPVDPPNPAPGTISARRRATVTQPVWRAVGETFEVQALALVNRTRPDWHAAGRLIDHAGPELLASVAPRQPGQSPEAWAAHCREVLRRAAREVRAMFEQIAREGSSPHLLSAGLEQLDAPVWVSVAPRSGPCPPGWEAIALLRRSGVARAAGLA